MAGLLATQGGGGSTSGTVSSTDFDIDVQIDDIDIGGDADMFTSASTDRMAEALIKRTGSPQVLEVVLTQFNAVLTVPGDDGPETLIWDGRSITAGGTGVSARKPFAVTRLDGAVLERLCGDHAPLLCTIIAGRPLPSDHGAWLTVVSDDGVRFTGLDGKPV